MMIRLWLLVLLALAVAAICGVKNCDVALAVVFIVGESRIPPPAGPLKYP